MNNKIILLSLLSLLFANSTQIAKANTEIQETSNETLDVQNETLEDLKATAIIDHFPLKIVKGKPVVWSWASSKASSEEASIIHHEWKGDYQEVYNESGTYSVTLYVEDNQGYSDEYTYTFYVEEEVANEKDETINETIDEQDSLQNSQTTNENHYETFEEIFENLSAFEKIVILQNFVSLAILLALFICHIFW